ncbi:hypothetical protein SAMN05216563_106135 [Phytobacter palmae]|nr:hypothetical protein SAMN05216563_106135 [Phytobacter palmae]
MLTDTQCRTARLKTNSIDSMILMASTGSETQWQKAWGCRFKLNGKSSMFALGEYPAVKLARNVSRHVNKSRIELAQHRHVS